ncbi:MAG: FtsX-like permease family protein [Ilumatobacteraceae bacterium]
MAAVLYRLRSRLRQRWRSTSLMVVIVALVTGIVLAVAAGAHRTQTAPDRYTEWAGGDFDALVTQQNGGLPMTSSVASLPGVDSVDGVTFVFAVVTDHESGEPIESFVFSGSAAAAMAALTLGRQPNPGIAGEFVATPTFVANTGASIGDEFDLITLTQAEADAGGFSGAFVSGATPQSSVSAVLVGIVDGASQFQDLTAIAVFSPALLQQADLGVSQTIMTIHLRDDVDPTELRTQLDTLPAGQSLAIGSGALIGPEVRRAVGSQALGLWLLAIVAAVAEVAVLGQVITRNCRTTSDERSRLAAIGCTDSQVLAEALGRAAIPIVCGCLLGTVVSVLPSASFPSGFARRIDPHPGFQVDPLVLLGGAAMLATALASWTILALVLTGRRSGPAWAPSAIESLARRSPSAAAATGLRLAFGRRSTERGGVVGPIVAVAASVALVVGAIVFGVSLDRLLDEPFRYGINYDVAAGDNGAVSLPADLLDAFDDDPDVATLTLYSGDFARSGATDIALLGVQRVRGDGAPTMTQGRFPVTSDEMALGRVTARDLSVGVGESVTLVGATDTRKMLVTGIAVVPGFGANEGVGQGGLVTMDGLMALDSDAVPKSIAIRFSDRPHGIAHFSDLTGWSEADQFRPSVIINLERVHGIPFVLAALLGGLSLLTIVNVTVSLIHSRRRDLAILRSLGADGGWLTRAIHWQASLYILIPALAGTALGVILGRQVFVVFADGIGSIDDAKIPLSLTVAVLIGCVIIANFAALIPGRAARRANPTNNLALR